MYMLVGDFAATDYCDAKHVLFRCQRSEVRDQNWLRNAFIAWSIETLGFQPNRSFSFWFE